MARRWSAAHAERRRCPGGSRSDRGTLPALHIRTQPTTSSISCDHRGVQRCVSTMASCSIVCGRVHRYPMPSRAWGGGAWSWSRQPSTERPLCRPFETKKADMVALSVCRHQRAPLMVALYDGAERPLARVFRAKRPKAVLCDVPYAGWVGGCGPSWHRSS